MTQPYLTPGKPRLFAHRGSAGHYPENTHPAFDAAREAGAAYLELDVWASRDGQVVVFHDETAQRTCGDPRRIADLELAEIAKLDAGYGFSADGGRTYPFRNQGVRVPTLAELFSAHPQALFNVEIKQPEPAVEELVVETVRKAGMEQRVLLAAEQDEIMGRIRRCCGDIPTSLSFGELERFYQWLGGGCQGPYTPPGVALQIPETYQEMTLVTPEIVAAAHAVGMEMHVWTVNDPSDMERLLRMGVDGVMSDYPERLIAVAKNIGEESKAY